MKADFHGCERSGGIYVIRNIDTGAFYIGETYAFRKRYLAHRQRLRAGTHSNVQLRAAASAGQRLLFEVICILPDRMMRVAVEADAIRSAAGECLYNAYDRRPPTFLGGKHSAGAKLRISAALLGRVISEKTRERQREAAAQRGYVPPPEDIAARISAAARARRHTPDARRKISEAQHGRKREPFGDEWRQNLKTARRAYLEARSDAERRAASESQRKRMTPEVRKKISETLKQRAVANAMVAAGVAK